MQSSNTNRLPLSIRNLSTQLHLIIRQRIYPLVLMALMLMVSGRWFSLEAQQFQKIPITQCGTVISSPGFYILSQSIKSASLTVDCIQVSSPGVILGLSGSNLYGPGGNGVTAAGIRILSSASGVVLDVDGTTIRGFGAGVVVEGSGVAILGGQNALTVTGNSAQGILLSNASSVVFDGGLNSRSNGGAGVELSQTAGVTMLGTAFLESNQGHGLWLHSSSGNQFIDVEVDQNKMSGIYVGESGGIQSSVDEGDQGNRVTTSGAAAPSQHNVFLVGGSILNTGAGIEIGLGDTMNVVFGIEAQSNTTYDAIDGNGDCTHNTWTQNTFTTTNPTCIQ